MLSLLVARRSHSGIPSKPQLLYEFLVDLIRNQVRSAVHIEGTDFIIPLAMALGLFILIANWLELIPTNDKVISPTSDLNLTLGMGVVVIILVQWYSIREQGFLGYLRHFTKPFDLPIPVRIGFIPLNVLEELVKPVTLALRLMGNIFAGGVMLFLIGSLLTLGVTGLTGGSAGGLLPLVGGSVIHVLWKTFDAGIGLLQAFIFTLLTIFYFSMAREGMEEEHH
jgi:F-type H+-transporting ATPase subunit a